MKKLAAVLAVLLAFAVPGEVPVRAETSREPALLSQYWTDGSEAAGKINEYIQAVTDEHSPDFIPVKKQFLPSERIPVENIPLLIRTDMHPLNPDLAFSNLCPAFLQVYFPESDTFDLRSIQGYTALYAVLYKIIVVGFPILGNCLDSCLVRHVQLLPSILYHMCLIFSIQFDCDKIEWSIMERESGR